MTGRLERMAWALLGRASAAGPGVEQLRLTILAEGLLAAALTLALDQDRARVEKLVRDAQDEERAAWRRSGLRVSPELEAYLEKLMAELQ